MRFPLLMLLGVMFVAGGCQTATTAEPDPFAVVPMDFSINVAILTGEGLGHRTEAHLRPSRLVLLADGSLQYGSDRHTSIDWTPDRTRRLNRQQMAELWSLSEQIGFTDPANGVDPVSEFHLKPKPGEVVYQIMFTGSRQSWEFVRRCENVDAPDAACVRLVRQMAQLAWATDVSEGISSIIPPRYDFGPDPYARYR